MFAAYEAAHAELAAEFRRRMAGELPNGFRRAGEQAGARRCDAKAETIATRKASQNALEALQPGVAGIARRLGRPARLPTSPTGQGLEARSARTGGGNYINYGVREFGMAAIMNGLALHGGCMPYGGTFLIFSRLRAQRAAHGRADEARA